MKKTILVLVTLAALLFTAAKANAQFGITGGLTTSTADIENTEARSINLYHLGLTYKFDLGLGFAVQPSLIYQVKGAQTGDLGSEGALKSFALKTGYIETPVSLQWGPDLLAFRPYLFAEPFLGYRVSDNSEYTGTGKERAEAWANDALNKLEYGFGLGAGIEIAKHFQVSAQYFTNLGGVFSLKDQTETIKSLKDVKNFQGIKFSLAILF